MNTQTKNKILNIIKENDSARPIDLVKELKLSPQIVHRHLKDLVLNGIIERKGSSPFTRYCLANRPDFSSAVNWYSSKKLSPGDYSKDYLCETRDVFSARLNHIIPVTKDRLSANDLSLVISIIGEIGNNSFDHNLGQWSDATGCWLETQLTKNKLWVIVADRGQGIYSSLSQTVKHLKTDQEAIEKAFYEHVSGRMPEQRGNGLKYVKQVIQKQAMAGLTSLSGKGKISLGTLGKDCHEVLNNIKCQKHKGTLTLIVWELK